jgi:hypothetical protein
VRCSATVHSCQLSFLAYNMCEAQRATWQGREAEAEVEGEVALAQQCFSQCLHMSTVFCGLFVLVLGLHFVPGPPSCYLQAAQLRCQH